MEGVSEARAEFESLFREHDPGVDPDAAVLETVTAGAEPDPR